MGIINVLENFLNTIVQVMFKIYECFFHRKPIALYFKPTPMWQNAKPFSKFLSASQEAVLETFSEEMYGNGTASI